MLRYLLYTFLVLFSVSFFAQESLKPLTANINYLYGDIKHSNRKQINSGSAIASKQNVNSISSTTVTSLLLPFIDDFSYSTRQSYPMQTLWSDSLVYINSGFAIAPLSIGVATFDGLNKYGYPYTPNLTNMASSLPADFLTSQPIDLSVSALPNGVADSVALTFYYQAKGNGEAPEITDSLLLDFYNPITTKWATVWYKRGNTSSNTNDTTFKIGYVKVDSTYYFQDGFKFRFRNKATTAGDFDHWNLDYVYLDKNRVLVTDTTHKDAKDFAFGYVPSPFLKNYSVMPWRQYNTNEMADHHSVFIRNNGVPNPNVAYANDFYDNTNTWSLLHHYFGGNYQPNYFKYTGWINYAPMSNPTNTFTLPSMTNFGDFTIVHYLLGNGGNDFIQGNDTVIQHQDFNNYYAYDDGSCEAAYYILGFGGKIALKYKTNVSDTLRSVRIFLDPADDNFSLSQNYTFRLTLWNVGSGGAPGSILYSDTVDKTLSFNPTGCYNCLSEYFLTSSLVLPPGSYFIGIQQKVAAGIKIGFDKNLDHSQNLYYDSGNGWNQSQIYGSLMLRPVFGTNPPTTGIKEIAKSNLNLFSVYPNPATDKFTIQSDHLEKGSFTLVNAVGQIINEGMIENQKQIINTENLNSGIYFLILKIKDQPMEQHKIIIQR